MRPCNLLHPPQRIETGQPLPPDCDSVAPFDAIKVANGKAEALVTINPGDGVLPAGGDSDPAIPLRRAGERLRLTDVAAFAATGPARVTVREPRIRVLPLRGSGIVVAAARLLAGDIERRGGAVKLDDAGRDLGTVLAAENTDAIVVIGGTGSGRNDNSVLTHGARLRTGAARHRADAGRNRGARLCRARGRCCCCRGGSTPRLPSG